MVKNSDGTWRMCIDFMSLNKAYPKDSYPLPEIDQKIESLEGFRLKCFLDAYKGYHQIRMAKEDEEKTSFDIEQGTFYYEKMSFGLKNALNATKAVSAVILTNRGNVQRLIYFVSMALQGSKINYPSLEKTSPIITRNSGCLAKWAIELGEHEIIYKPRSVIKGQVLEDFLTESPTNNNTMVGKVPRAYGKDRIPTWTLFTNGASNIEGLGAGLILTNPDGQEISYALRFNFKASNNKAEYEALVAGLELAIQMKARWLNAYTDSLLIVNQVKGFYEAREDLMKRYLSKIQEMLKQFKNFTITQVL
ncbi:reverse transcriptase domain-containing protein, partial [Tanacetum coccineum]